MVVNAAPAGEERSLVDRDIYYGLWNETGPVPTDVKQNKVLNCWWAACSLSVLIANQNWIENLIHYGNNASMVNVSWPQDAAVQVTLWDPTPNVTTPLDFTANAWDKSTTEDHPDGNWWHDALSQGVKQLGQEIDMAGIFKENGTFDPTSGSARLGLRVLTGYEAVSKLTSEYSGADEFFDDLAKANTSTPVVFNTLVLEEIGVTVPQLGDSHDYAVFNGTDYGNGTKTIWARNSWGSTDEFHVEDIYDNTFQIFHLVDWQPLQWPGPGIDTGDGN
ncbi:hypothetical protein IAT38_002664 [Cryptococcus sp. DSM 104549]